MSGEVSYRKQLPPHVSAILRAARADRRLTIRQAAALAGISAGYLSKLEHAQACPSVPVAEGLARALLAGRPQDRAVLMAHALPGVGRDYPRSWREQVNAWE